MTSQSSSSNRSRTAATRLRARRTWRRIRSSTQSFALVPEARLMFPKAYVIAGFFQDDWRVRSNLTLNLGLRYDVEIIKDIPDWPAGTDANNFDPRIGFAWDPKGNQRWAVRGGFGRFTQQHPIFTIVKGGVGGRNGQVTVNLTPADALFPTFPNTLPAFPPGAVLPARSIQEISPDLEKRARLAASIGFQRQLGIRTSVAVDANINRGVKHGFLDMNAPVPISKDVLNAALSANPNAVVRTVAQADLHAADRAGEQRLPAHGPADQRGALLVSGHPLRRSAPDHAAHPDGVVHASKSEDRLNHWFSPENSTDPESDRRPTGADTPHNLVTSIVEHPGARADLQRLAAQHGDPFAERRAVIHPLCWRPCRL